MAIFDWLATALAAYLITIYYVWPNRSQAHGFWYTFFGVFLVTVIAGVIVHWVFGIPTRFNYYLGLATNAQVMNLRDGTTS